MKKGFAEWQKHETETYIFHTGGYVFLLLVCLLIFEWIAFGQYMLKMPGNLVNI